MRARQIKNVHKPNLMRDVFPYNTVPVTVLEESSVPINMPEQIWITDTTFRDGQQARPPYTVDQIVHLFELLHKLDNGTGTIKQSEFFLYSDRDKLVVEKCLEKGYDFPEVTGWIRANGNDFDLIKSMGLKETGILTSCSDYHIYLKMGLNRQRAADKYIDVVEKAIEAGVRPRCHLEDITRADFNGFVIPFVQRLMKISEQTDECLTVKIRACDTLGYGVPNPHVALPRGVPKVVYALVNDAGVPPKRLEWHGHNDFHKVAANVEAAWLYGACAANCTLLGYGERTGNPSLEGMIINYCSLKGDPGLNTQVITEIAEYYRKEIGAEIPANYPFVGRDFNTTRAGIHADGLQKNEEIYNAFDTEKMLGRPPSIAITDRSGRAGIVGWIITNTLHRPSKFHPGVGQVVDFVEDEYRRGRTTAISYEEMSEQVNNAFNHNGQAVEQKKHTVTGSNSQIQSF